METKQDNGKSITVTISEGVTGTLDGTILTFKGANGETSRDFLSPLVKTELKNNEVTVSIPVSKRKYTRMFFTTIAHIKNMIEGAKEGFTYELKICSGHFPMTVKKEGNEVVISNFLGEKIPRRSTIVEGVNLDIKGDIIIVNSPNIEDAGQTAANLERATFIKKRDRRVFQDGCYITSKPQQK